MAKIGGISRRYARQLFLRRARQSRDRSAGSFDLLVTRYLSTGKGRGVKIRKSSCSGSGSGSTGSLDQL
jgi:hypothetical protein